ncbi:hypothetical protein RB195_005826 [Necator americanus]|uniref:Uncharacterized protein n=1 Tax=Necator americanus TaxID=51031 RepID=A0ABR1BRL2_NECAM
MLAVTFVWTEDVRNYSKSTAKPFPFSENLVKLEQISIQNVTKEQEQILKRSNIPPAFWPFVNISAVEQRERKRNATDGGVITDEDIADMPDDDEQPKPNTMHSDGKKTTITMSTEAGMKLYQHWTDQAVSGLMAAVATNKLKNLGHAEKVAHKQCNKEVKTVAQHAKCVLALLEAEEKYQRWLKKFAEKKSRIGRISALRKHLAGMSRKDRFQHFGRHDSSFRMNGKEQLLAIHQKSQMSIPKLYSKQSNWIGPFRMRAKRSTNERKIMNLKPVTRDSYDLISEQVESPLGLVAKNLLRDLRKLKNKRDDFKHWKQVITELREEGRRMEKQRKGRRNVDKRLKMFFHALREEGVDLESGKATNIFGDEVRMDKLMRRAREEEQKVTTEDKLMKAPIELVRQAMKISMMMSGKNVSDFDKKNIKMISPRFMPVVPEEYTDNDTIKLVSPSLFALHDDGNGIEKETSLAKTMKIFGEKDNMALLDFIIEASGVSDTLDDMKKEKNSLGNSKQYDNPLYSSEGQPLWFTKENVTEIFGDKEKNKVEAFEELLKVMTEDQISQMNHTGYTIMNEQQLDVIYGPSSPYHDPLTRKRLSNVSAADIPVVLDQTVRGLAAETMKFKVERQKDITLSPLLFSPVILDPAGASQPIILSPLLFDPIVLSPAVFGVVILSPYLFTPVILSPRVLSPIILAPHLFSPTILSPLVLSPIILSSGVMNPIIITPLLLSPFILHPVALNPLILAPFCLNPFIGVPHTLSPLILSPFVLSPVIYSPPFYSAFLLTPHALSPSIQSKGQHFVSILSPSWLS